MTRKGYTGLLLTVLVLFCMVAAADAEPPNLFPSYRATIALDPGHGGKDQGSRGPGGLLEKDICLEIARRMAVEMEPEYQIILTRSDDYNVPLPDRAAMANHHKADVLISIHAAAGYLTATTGTAIYTFQPLGKLFSHTPVEPALSWDHAQEPHAAAGRALAETLRLSLATVSEAAEIRIVHAPLAVLKGAQMPAILIEIGYLSNPATEKNLNTEAHQTAYAQAIAQGIDNYLAAVREKAEKH